MGYFRGASRLSYVSNKAAMRADAMLEAGDLDGLAVWRRILRAVGEIQGTAPKSGEAVH